MPDISSFPITHRWPAFAKRHGTLTRVFFQMSAIAPIFGRLGFFLRCGGKDYQHSQPRQRLVVESERLLGFLDCQLKEGHARPAVQRGLHMPARPA